MISANLASYGWELKVNVYEFNIIEHKLRVKGDTHIGGVIFQLVEQLNTIKNDWSDFGLWWPDKNLWLNKTKMTLDQYGVQADALLYFTRIHKNLRVQLPDYQIVDINVDSSVNLFSAVKQICKDFGIRHPEEVSLLRDPNTGQNTTSKNKSNTKNKKSNNDEILLKKENDSLSSDSTLNNSNGSKLVRERSHSLSIGNGSLNGFNNDPQSLSLSPIIHIQEYLKKNGIKYKTVFDKTRINSRYAKFLGLK